MAASRGNALKLVFAARNRIRAVLTAKVKYKGDPAPKAVRAAIATIEGPPSWVGRSPNATANTVMPTNRIANRMAIAVIVSAAFFDSGGLKAGTPLAIASTPVNATDPPAKALSSRRTPSVWVPNGTASGSGGTGVTVPVTMWKAPTATMVRASPTNRYVGTVKMLPDSRRPRRLATVIRAIETKAISIRTSYAWGITD